MPAVYEQTARHNKELGLDGMDETANEGRWQGARMNPIEAKELVVCLSGARQTGAFSLFPLSPRLAIIIRLLVRILAPVRLLTKVGMALSWAAPCIPVASLSTPEEPCVPSRWDHLAHFKLKWVESHGAT